jgi:hypothetical protein
MRLGSATLVGVGVSLGLVVMLNSWLVNACSVVIMFLEVRCVASYTSCPAPALPLRGIFS